MSEREEGADEFLEEELEERMLIPQEKGISDK